MTTEEVQAEIAKHLGQTEPRAEVSVTLAQASGVHQVAGEHLIGPDGYVNLGVYGSAYVSGMTVDEARRRHGKGTVQASR